MNYQNYMYGQPYPMPMSNWGFDHGYMHNWAPYGQWCPNCQHTQLPMESSHIKDFGGEPYVINIHQAAKENTNFRTAIWTGEHLQVTLMSIPVNGDVVLEVHPKVDQFLRVEQGQGLVQMGHNKNHLNYSQYVCEGDAIMVPAGIWHNLVNTGNHPLKLYSIYAPPNHPFGTVDKTKADAEKRM